MKEFKFTPEACKGENAVFSGDIILTAPTFDDRYDYIEKANFEMDENGQIKAGLSQMPALRKMVKFSQKHYKEVSLINNKTAETYGSFDDLTYDPACDGILIEVAMALMNGFKLGKN